VRLALTSACGAAAQVDAWAPHLDAAPGAEAPALVAALLEPGASAAARAAALRAHAGRLGRETALEFAREAARLADAAIAAAVEVPPPPPLVLIGHAASLTPY